MAPRELMFNEKILWTTVRKRSQALALGMASIAFRGLRKGRTLSWRRKMKGLIQPRDTGRALSMIREAFCLRFKNLFFPEV